MKKHLLLFKKRPKSISKPFFLWSLIEKYDFTSNCRIALKSPDHQHIGQVKVGCSVARFEDLQISSINSENVEEDIN